MARVVGGQPGDRLGITIDIDGEPPRRATPDAGADGYTAATHTDPYTHGHGYTPNTETLTPPRRPPPSS
ncbi:MAG: hypothetical protein R2911_37460 [Caldilineaceae bacterium]